METNSWARISSLAKDKNMVFTNLCHHINLCNLREGYHALDGSKARGIDGVSKADYGKNLDGNLGDLLRRLKEGSYKPQPKREKLIPKANGKLRPIAIACFEDKLVEYPLSKILEAVYEQGFYDFSYGFRPGKSCDGAIRAAHKFLENWDGGYVVEIDLKNFFNTVPHRFLLKLISLRIADRRLKSLIMRFLQGEVLKESGEMEESELGTPQGGILSPVLANIYLHYALDSWFTKNYASKNSKMIRYADDAVFFFKDKQTAETFLEDLRQRLAKYKLELNEEKTGIIQFTPQSKKVFHFLGFTFYCSRKRKGRKQMVKVKTHKEKLFKKVEEFKSWIQTVRSKLSTREIFKIVIAKLRGHYNYFGFWCNRSKLFEYHHHVVRILFKWLNRRSQRKSLTWDSFLRKLSLNRIPGPPEMEKLKQLGWNPYAYAR